MPDDPALSTWRMVSRTPDAGLRGSVQSYTSYAEPAPAPMRRLEVPFTGIPLILSLGPSCSSTVCVIARSSPASTTGPR